MSGSEGNIEEFVSNFSKSEHTSQENDGLFYFETDYLPLKSNPDYLKLMRCLVSLEAQRISVNKDIEDLEKLKYRAIEDPISVKEQVLEGHLTCLNRCTIEKVPEIDFSKYKCPNTNSPNKKNQLFTRRMAKNQVSLKNQSNADTEIKVRGRLYNEKKPRTFNQLWTAEEQLRLEELLVKYPPEPIESRRFEKIAQALGNRTPQQVCSRVQKYNKKLAKAGIKNRDIRRTSCKKVDAQKVHKQHKHYLYKPSTFFPSLSMGETESEDQSDDGLSDLSHWPEIHRKLKEERNIDHLKIEHIGYQCQYCQQKPIVGIRWDCKSCPKISFCSTCIFHLCKINPPPHPITHRFRSHEVTTIASYLVQ